MRWEKPPISFCALCGAFGPPEQVTCQCGHPMLRPDWTEFAADGALKVGYTAEVVNPEGRTAVMYNFEHDDDK